MTLYSYLHRSKISSRFSSFLDLQSGSYNVVTIADSLRSNHLIHNALLGTTAKRQKVHADTIISILSHTFLCFLRDCVLIFEKAASNIIPFYLFYEKCQLFKDLWGRKVDQRVQNYYKFGCYVC